MAKEVVRTFYNPKEKANYYGNQLKSGIDSNGKALTKRQKSFRAGYLKAYHASVSAYYAKNPDKRPAKSN